MYFVQTGTAYFPKWVLQISIRNSTVMKEVTLHATTAEDQCSRRINCIGDVRNYAIMTFVTNASILLKSDSI